jgi:hypothetical protein
VLSRVIFQPFFMLVSLFFATIVPVAPAARILNARETPHTRLHSQSTSFRLMGSFGSAGGGSSHSIAAAPTSPADSIKLVVEGQADA